MAALCVSPTSVASSASSLVNAASSRQLLASPSAVSVSSPSGVYPSVRCGRGDSRTAKGKRFKGSFGNARPKDSSKGKGLATTALPPRPPKKDEFDDGEFIQVDLDETLFAN
ncbi:30S ribosomal protein S31 [Marchantia polymorpha subsp. ruderalis]|uniref:30S ribosomal protein n=2 Tax=Marchantia polymorpha TaxID=3197 RepID=A0AAF6ALB9_MARPO|nr:hypothetical protein MARPO_0005s0194 [Marchantia polymorpha]BBM97239.1 hypothetical protein Mp_1g04130 [Marchantia polymorpha subsp. ruderalis]|eukprot:PTQ48569.1 hypothetical protein MARPO_0005s0194 [Marchantia polymorpha]